MAAGNYRSIAGDERGRRQNLAGDRVVALVHENERGKVRWLAADLMSTVDAKAWPERLGYERTFTVRRRPELP